MTERAADPTSSTLSAGPDGSRRQDGDDVGTSPLIEEELLVEDVSIDGMCGVY